MAFFLSSQLFKIIRSLFVFTIQVLYKGCRNVSHNQLQTLTHLSSELSLFNSFSIELSSAKSRMNENIAYHNNRVK